MPIDKSGLEEFTQNQSSRKNPPLAFIPVHNHHEMITLLVRFFVNAITSEQYNEYFFKAKESPHANIPRLKVWLISTWR
jgi:hypothetical protein